MSRRGAGSSVAACSPTAPPLLYTPVNGQGAALFRQIGGGEIIIIVVVLVFLFGAKKLPELARSIGRSAKELREGLKEGAGDEDEPDPS